MKISRTGEIHQCLHDTIEAADFAVNDVHVTPGIRFLFRQLVPQELQMKDDSVDGVLHLMGHSPGKASARGKTARHFDLIANAAYGFGIAHDQQSSNLRVLFLYEIQGNLDALSSRSIKLPLRQGATPVKGL